MPDMLVDPQRWIAPWPDRYRYNLEHTDSGFIYKQFHIDTEEVTNMPTKNYEDFTTNLTVTIDTANVATTASTCRKEQKAPLKSELLPRRIFQYDGRHTTVEWTDGTKTTVCCEDPEKYTEWSGFCACVVKKLYGSTSKAELEFNGAQKRTSWPARKKKIDRERRKRLIADRVAKQKREREQKIQAEMDKMRIIMEANKRMFHDDCYMQKEELDAGVCENGGEQ